jgi:hypothetical protein
MGHPIEALSPVRRHQLNRIGAGTWRILHPLTRENRPSVAQYIYVPKSATDSMSEVKYAVKVNSKSDATIPSRPSNSRLADEGVPP